MNDGSSDLDKLKVALSEVVERFSSLENVFESFGLSTLPTAQRYGILFGCLTFGGTMIAVFTLLTLGGSFTRIAEQTKTGEASVKNPHKVRADRPLLLERLLESRQYLIQQYNNEDEEEQNNNNDNTNNNETKYTPLQKVLLNVAPVTKDDDEEDEEDEEQEDDDDEKKQDDDDNETNKKKNKKVVFIPPGYEDNYKVAYQKCQDKPGGEMLGGRPEARFEAYARAYAGCSGTNIIMKNYRRSYAKLYEAISCTSHATDDYYTNLWEQTPESILGKFIRLEPLDCNRHLKCLWDCTNGQPYLDQSSYDANEIWSFLPYGPFESKEALQKSELFAGTKRNSQNIVASYAIVQNITDTFLGVIQLSNDDPYNLSIQLEAPILPPHLSDENDDTPENKKIVLETCFLLLDKLFSLGYRRIQMSLDHQDVKNKKLATRLCFTLEGLCYRAAIIKESNSDRNMYALLNNEFFMDKGVRFIFYKRLYGTAVANVDATMRKTEDENDIKLEHLKNEKEKQEQEQLAAKKDK